MEGNETEPKQIYQVTHRETGEKRIVASFNANSACCALGWIPSDCHVIEAAQEKHRLAVGYEPICVKVPCYVCSFQWSECLLRPGYQCPCSPNTPDIHEWTRQVTKAHLCSHAGIPLEKKDHHLHQKWLPMEEAVKELSIK